MTLDLAANSPLAASGGRPKPGRCVVISQPMWFPWVGLLEQIRLADTYVHYDDVQFSHGSFVNRVQVKTAAGPRWLTIPLAGSHLGQTIAELRSNETTDWRARHLALLAQAYAGAPHVGEMLDLAGRVYGLATDRVADLAIASLEELGRYFDLPALGTAVRSSALGVPGRSSERVLAVVETLGGDRYVSGHGGRRYLDPRAFAGRGVHVEYLAYEKRPYPQQHGPFTPFVSALDLVANVGRAGRSFIASGTVPWQEALVP